MIQEVGTLQGINYIRMINKSGNITFSTDKDEIGRYLDKTEAGCNVCHTSGEPKVQASTMTGAGFFMTRQESRSWAWPKHLQRKKLLCVIVHFHPPKQRILGVLDIHRFPGKHAYDDRSNTAIKSFF